MIVTIDGPAGSGKSTVARKLAAQLGIAYLDTGAMYRAVAYAARLRNADLDDGDALLGVLRSIRLELDCGPTFTRVSIDGHDVSEATRTMAVSEVTSKVAAQKDIRANLVERQREIGRRLGSFVSEGRDQGSVVFPEADAKFVLEAHLERRAERRFREMQADGQDVTLKQVRENLVARDRVDARQWEPLLRSGVALVIETSELSITQVIETMQRHLPDDHR